MIAEYIRDNSGKKRGLVMAVLREDGYVGIGWSVCNKKDVFDRDRAWSIAQGRAVNGREHLNGHIPSAAADAIEKMFSRASKYYHISPENIIVSTMP